MNFVNEIVRFVQGNCICLTDAAYLLVHWPMKCPFLEVSPMFLQQRTSLRYRSLNQTIKQSIYLFDHEEVQI